MILDKKSLSEAHSIARAVLAGELPRKNLLRAYNLIYRAYGVNDYIVLINGEFRKCLH